MNATPAPRPPASRLEEALRSRRFVITTEIAPPVSFDPQDLLAKALPLKGLADAVNVTDGASARAHLSAPIAAALMVQHGIEPILQLTCRDRNRIALQADLMGAAATGVHNLLTLTGDDPKAGDQPETKAVFDIDSTTLTAMARRMGDAGELPTGRKIAGRASFFIGAADAPVDPPPGWQPTKLAAKIAAGAQFAQTQFCMDGAIVRRYTERLAANEATRDLHLIDRHCAAALRQIRALDEGAPVGHHHPGRLSRPPRRRRRSRSGGSAHLHRADRGLRRASPASPGCTSWRRPTRRRCRR